MSKLVNYGAGEISDRLTILSLKILHGEHEGIDVKHFRDERNALLVQIRSRTLNGAWFEQVLELAAVNSHLWHAEDVLRAHRDDEHPPAGIWRVACEIQALNDQRSALIRKINELAGEPSGAEKVGLATARG